MNHFRQTFALRGLLALAILLSGVALVPYVELPSKQLNWRLYAGIYEPMLAVNYSTGSPGSFFTFNGSNFPADSAATIEVNGAVVGTVTTDDAGAFTFLIDTAGAIAGTYSVTAIVDGKASATTEYTLDPAEPLREPEGSGPVFHVVFEQWLPLIMNNEQ